MAESTTAAWLAPSPQAPGTTYLVGGAVRDALLGLPVGERDWVVTGSDPAAMLAAGFRPVGKDFPVFLHPRSGEEYALARTERKQGQGHHGFSFHADPSVTLEDDLWRRDLSINAIAQSADGQLIDPCGGARDLAQRRLRHVSPAFVEDPLRVLRVARFAARFAALDFTLDGSTLVLLREISASGELRSLPAERVWRETQRALMCEQPAVYFQTLRDAGALVELLPELDRLFGVPQTARYHPEIDSGIHALLALDQSARLNGELAVRYAVLCHDFGKGITPAEILPSHRGHEARGLPLATAVSRRFKVPRELAELAELVVANHLLCHQASSLRPKTLLALLERLDVFRRPLRLEQFVQACEADARGRTGLEDEPYPSADFLRAAGRVASDIDISALRAAGHDGPRLGKAIRAARLDALTAWKATQ